MGKGARKGEARLKGFRHVPDALKLRLEEQEATVRSKLRSRQKAVIRNKDKAKFEKGPTVHTFDVEPKGKNFPHVKLAEQYVNDVLAGKVLVCNLVKQACARYLRLKADPQLLFSPVDAERVCNTIEQFPHVKGRWKTTNITLEPWQCFVLVSIFGFFWAHDPTQRVVKTVYIEVPRKNAKSTLAAGVGLYMLTEDGEPGPEVYSAATTHKQALAIFDTARAMARRQFAFAEKHDVVVQSKDIKVWGTLGKFEALHAQGETLDGLNGYCILVDELHAHKTRAVYDVLETSLGSRENPLMFNITTAGFNRAGVCYDMRTYIRKLLDGVHEDVTTFGIIYTIDKDDDPHDPNTWRKANPNFGVSVKEEQLRRLSVKAKVSNQALATFLTKHLNVWVNAAVGWMDMTAWDACADAPPIEHFRRETAKMGIDLASKVDINSKVIIFRTFDDQGNAHYWVYAKHYVPEARARVQMDDEDADDNASAYHGWAQSGHLTLTPGNVIDMDEIEKDIKVDATEYHVAEIGYDPYQATQLAKHLMDEGLNMVELRPTVLNFSEPMKEIERLALKGFIHHTGDPVLAWMVSNVVVKIDSKDNIFPRKENDLAKIDGAVAMFMAMNRWLVGETEEESHGLVVL